MSLWGARLKHIRLIVLVPLFTLLDCGVHGWVRLEVPLVEDTIFDAFKLFESFHDGTFLANVDFVGTLLDILDRLILVVQFLRLEVGNSGRCTIAKGTSVIDHRGCPLLI